LLPVLLVAILPAHPALGQGDAARQQEVEMAFDHYTSAKTEDQRVAIIDYLQHYESKMVAGALVDHIIASEDGERATAYDRLVAGLGPDGAAAVLDRMATTPDAVSKGKLVVALRHCQGPDVLHGLIGSLSDKRSVPFEAHGAHPRRVCDLAYDELFLKLRTDQRYNLDPSPRMTGIITEHTPVKSRDALIAKLQSLIAKYPVPTPSPSPVAHPEAGPATQL
jgi:hypothetical protein